jgi:hypothetical protein
MGAVVDEPHVTLRVVRIHEDAMRPHEHLVVLIPRLDELAAAVHHVEHVIPPRMAGGVFLRHVITRRVARGDEAVGGAA